LKIGEEKKHLELLNLCYSPWGDDQQWRRLYLQEGFDSTKNVLVVEENGEWGGGVTAWFREVLLARNKGVKAYIAGDGYVLPDHRGKGLYSFYMKTVNEMAKSRGSALGLGFISAYNLPPQKALPKIGFVDALIPSTEILVLNPERFFDYVLTEWTQEVQIPSAFEKMKFAIMVSFKSYKGKVALCKKFTIENGKLTQLSTPSLLETAKDKTDLRVNTDIETLAEVIKQFNFGRKKLLFALLAAIINGRLSLRFSFKLLKALIRL